jgi:hypothetical protein
MNEKHIACDVDEVIVNISPKWILLSSQILPHNTKLKNCIMEKEKEGIYEKFILERSHGYIQTMLEKEFDVTKEEISKIDELYYSNETFYDDLKPTKFAESLIKASNLGKLNSITFITKNRKKDDPSNASKIRFLNHYFKNVKIKIFEVFDKEPKSAVLNKNGPFDIFVDDSLDNIAEVLANGKKGKVKEILIPSLGYNKDIPEIIFLAAKLNGINIGFID